jgi:hypothetical protein
LIVEVEMFGQLQPQLPRLQSIEVAESSTVFEVAKLLGLSLDEVGLITINGIQCEELEKLPPDSRLCFFTHMSGG